MASHVASIVLEDPKSYECSAHNFMEFLGPMAQIWLILEIPSFVISHDQKHTD